MTNSSFPFDFSGVCNVSLAETSRNSCLSLLLYLSNIPGVGTSMPGSTRYALVDLPTPGRFSAIFSLDRCLDLFFVPDQGQVRHRGAPHPLGLRLQLPEVSGSTRSEMFEAPDGVFDDHTLATMSRS